MGPFPARRIECSKRGNGGAGMKGQAGEHLEGQLWAVGLVIVANLLTLAALLGRWLTVDTVVSDEEKYIVSGALEGR